MKNMWGANQGRRKKKYVVSITCDDERFVRCSYLAYLIRLAIHGEINSMDPDENEDYIEWLKSINVNVNLFKEKK